MKDKRSKTRKYAWNTHALLTRGALLSSFHWPRHDEEASIVHLTEFLRLVQRELPALLRWYWDLLARKNGDCVAGREDPRSSVETVAHFLHVMKLNPGTSLHHVRLRPPEEVPLDALHDPGRDGPPGRLYEETRLHETITAGEILFTFCDEPDWGMDQDLFQMENHPYGQAPFGMTTGMSSQGPFHMAFFHENALLTTLLPVLRRSFVAERVKVFQALAHLAFDKGVNYWGWRFTAWAVHYVQDLTQPYHARAFPPATIPVMLSILLKPDSRTLTERINDVLKNRHTLFEAAVHFLLNDAVKRRADHPLLSALSATGDSYHGRLDDVVRACSQTPARLAPRVDRTLVELFEDLPVDSADHFASSENISQSCHMLAEAAQQKPDAFARFVELIGTCLRETGRVTRYVVTGRNRSG